MIDDKNNMYNGALPMLFEIADGLRSRMTMAEEILWNVIKINEWHLKFRRQHPVSLYIADFYCHKIKLVIELDGGYHEHKEVKIYDEAREKDINEFGITVLRFRNEEVINETEKVLAKIGAIITTLQKRAEIPYNAPLGDGGSEIPYNAPLGDGGSEIPYNAPLGDGGSEIPYNAPLGDGGSEIPYNAPLGDGGLTSRYRDKLFIIKVGGNIIDDDVALQSFLSDFASISQKKILIHGGGKIATKIGERLGIQSNYINGRRITDAATIDLVTMVYGGLVNKKIVAKLQSLNCDAIGLTGADANIIPATKRPVVRNSETINGEGREWVHTPPLGDGGIDYGFVGDIKSSSLGIQNLELLLNNNFTLVVAPLTHDGNGQMLNTNADTIASTLAVGLSQNYEVRLIYCFEKKGVLEDVDNENSVIPLITKEKYSQLIKDKKLFEGILPKIDNAFAAIDNGVNEVLIGDANDLLKNVTAETSGTLIR